MSRSAPTSSFGHDAPAEDAILRRRGEARRVYLDHNATAPVRPEVVEVVVRAMAAGGNPSSLHTNGRLARGMIEAARRSVALLTGGRATDVVFTSGGTESNAIALRPGVLRDSSARSATRLIVGAGEHASVLAGHGFRGTAVRVVALDADGVIRLDDLARVLAEENGTALVSVQVANNETGVLQPLDEVVRLARQHGALVHVDAVQGAGRVALDIGTLGVDALTISAHKLGGPTGVGALVLGAGADIAADRGAGGQEGGRRPGTENVAGITGLGVAAELAASSLGTDAARLCVLRGALETEIRCIVPDAVIFGDRTARLPNTVCFAAPGLAAETLLIALDLDGVAVSSGSACSSGRVGRSHVLAAMGVEPALAAGAIRVSVGWNSTEKDVCDFAHAFGMAAERLYRRWSPRAA